MNHFTPVKRPVFFSFGWPWFRGLSAGLVVCVAFVALYTVDIPQLLRGVLKWIEQLGPWGPFLYAAIFILAAVCLVPVWPLTLGAGAVFGLPWGVIYASIASTLGATAAFLVGRHLARDWVARKTEGNASLAAVDRAVEQEGWRIVLLLRLSPLFPFNLLNYAFGLTRVKWLPYFIATWIGMMPSTIMYVYLGALARAGVDLTRRTVAEWVFYGFGLVATLIAVILITGMARRALAGHGHNGLRSQRTAGINSQETGQVTRTVKDSAS
jgi:uncharacterized membrane protein YdjX (TVP38/TMEM64 family)